MFRSSFVFPRYSWGWFLLFEGNVIPVSDKNANGQILAVYQTRVKGIPMSPNRELNQSPPCPTY